MFNWLLKGWRKREAEVVANTDSSAATDIAGEPIEPVVSQTDVDEYLAYKKLRRLFRGVAVPRNRYERR